MSDLTEIKVAVARIEEQLTAMVKANEEHLKIDKEFRGKQEEKIENLEKSKWKQWIAIVLISAGINLPPWLSLLPK